MDSVMLDLVTSGSRRLHVLAGLFVLTACAGSLQANVLTATGPAAVTCNTATGPGANATIVVKPSPLLTGSATIAVSFAAPSNGIVVTAPGSTTLSTANQTAGLSFTVNVTAGCAGASTGATLIQFKAGGVNDATATVNDTVTSTASALVASGVTITCGRNPVGPVYTPGAAQTISVTSTATGGTPFTVDNSGTPPPGWLTVSSFAGGTANSTAVTFTVVAAAGCGGFAAGTSNIATLHLLNAPAPDKLVTVTLLVVPPSPLTATPNPASLSYVKGSGTAGHVDVNVTSLTTPAPFFAVDTSSLPIWLTVDSVNGTVPKSLRFTTTTVSDTLAPGTYNATVRLKVSGSADLSLPISLLVNNKAPRLSVAEGTTRNISWVIGQALPSPFITAVSSDSPVSYTATSGGTLAPIISAAQQKGLAYSFGTQIGVSFNPLIFAAAQPGSVLTGTVTLTWGSPASTIVVTFNITVVSPGATLSGLTPASLPTAASGQTFSVVVTGTGFVPSTDPLQKTRVGVVVAGSLVNDTNISANVINPSNIILTITVPATADTNLPFSQSGSGGPVTLGICNPAGGTCSIPTGTAVLTIGAGPLIQAVTSASAFLQVTPPTLPTMAPWDMVSIFGANFCSSGGTGCSSSQLLYGTPDPVTLRFPTSVSPDATGATQRSLSVTFQTHGGSPAAIANAPLLFGTNGQINLIVPGAVSAYIGSTVDIVVNFGYGTGSTLLKSAAFPVNIVATNPGIFTVGADGQGDGAILGSNYALIGATNPAGMRSTGADSDVIQLYVTGLGAPDSTADNGVAGGGLTWSTDCVSLASFLTSLNTVSGTALTNLDGTVMQSDLLNSNRLPPCIGSSSANVPTVTVGGIAATVLYAGFVPDTVAGLYQLNVLLPGTSAGSFQPMSGSPISTIVSPVQLPVVITANSVTSQSGVSVWVTPRLKVDPPSGAGLTGTVGVPWSSSSNAAVASEGTSTYKYALTSGLLPAGLSLGATTGAITGTPAANTAGTYVVTVTSTDSANIPVTGTTTFTLTVAGGLFMTSVGSGTYTGTFGTANPTLTPLVTATGGVFPYAFTITSPASLPTGMTIGATTGRVGISALTPAGTYHVTVTATDSTAGTPLTGTITFDVVVNLRLVNTTPTSQGNGTSGVLTTVTATGNTGTITYTLDAASITAGLAIDANTGDVTPGTATAGTYSITVTATDDTAPTGAATPGTGTRTVSVTVT